MRIRKPTNWKGFSWLKDDSLSEKSNGKGPFHRGLFLILISILACLLAGFIFSTPQQNPNIPLPANLESLDPQLRDYILKVVAGVRHAPRDSNRYATLGIVYAVNGLWSEARKTFSIASKLNPKEPLAMLYVGISSQELGEFDLALKQFQELAIQFPEFPYVHYRLGELNLRQGAFKEAGLAFQKLISLAPSEWRGYVGLGQVKISEGETEEAVSLFQKALELDPTSKIAHHQLGLAYRNMGELEAAKKELAIGQGGELYPMPDPWSITAGEHTKTLTDQIEMADDYGMARLPWKAVEILESARAYHPDNIVLLNNLAVAYLRANQVEKASSFALRVLELDDRNIAAHVSLSTCYLGMNQSKFALEHADQVIKLSPSLALGYISKANVLLSLEKDSEAFELIKTAIRLDPKNPQLLLDAGDVLQWNLSQPDEAVEYYRQALEQNPAMLEAHGRLADLFTQLGRKEDAYKQIEILNQLKP